jgi:hypothetical protein
MRPAKLLLMALIVGALTAGAVSAKEYDRFGKGALSIGATPPGISSYSGGYVYTRQYVQPAATVAPAPVVASVPATADRRAFSAEPSTPDCTAPAVAAAPATDGRRAFSAEPTTAQPAAPAVVPMARTRGIGPEYNRFGKGPTTIGLTPPGFSK